MRKGGFGKGTRHIRIRSGTRCYRCQSCGFVFSPLKAPEKTGVPAGTRFESLPEDWVCPQCGAGKRQFVKVLVKGNG